MLHFLKDYRKLLLAFILTIGILPMVSYGESSDFKNEFIWKEFPSVPAPTGMSVQHGLASPFAGNSQGVVFVAGGCNFPGKPVFEGGKKRYYNDLFVLVENKEGEPEWISGFNIEKPTAYGASVSLDEGVLCMGGNNTDTYHTDVYLLKWNAKNQTIVKETYPSLPFPMARMSAAIIDQQVYIAGGIVNGKPSNKFLKLDLSKKGDDDFKWEVLPGFPGVARQSPVMVSQNDAEETRIYLFSGSSYPESSKDPLIQTDGLVYSPKLKTWSKLSSIQPEGNKPYSLHGADGIASGSNHILFVGGVNRDIFFDAWKKEREGATAIKNEDAEGIEKYKAWKYEYLTYKPEWYKFNKDVLAYNTITDSWAIAGEYPFPGPAGAPVVKWKKGWLVVNGEIKPGVRSPKVYYGELKVDPQFGIVNWIVLIVYLFGMLYLGYFFMKREQSSDDFFKGGGRIPWWAAGMSIFATMLSAITFMAIPAKTFATDWRYYPMAFTILVMAFPVVKYYLPFFRRLNVTTAYEYLEQRFNYANRFVASFLFIIFMVARMALVLFLPSLALTTVTGIDIFICITLMGIITIIYCTMGGVEAVVWGDVIQGFVLLGGALVAVVFLVTGTEGGLSKVIEITIDHEKMRMFDFAFDFTSATLWVILLGGLANNLIAYSSDQTVIQRYLTTKDEKSASKSIILNGFLSVFVSLIFYFIGTALYAFYKTNPSEMNFAMGNADSIFPHFIMSKMPVGVAGLLIAAIFAATMSTVSSNVNSLSTAFTADFYKHFFPETSDHKQLVVARWAGIVLGGVGVLFALLMATLNILSLFDYFNYILGLLASGLGGLFAMGIFFPRIDARSALIGFLVGTILLILVSIYSNLTFWLYGFVGMFATVFIGWLASIIWPGKRKDLQGLTWSQLNGNGQKQDIFTNEQVGV